MCDEPGKEDTESAGAGQEANVLGVHILKIVSDRSYTVPMDIAHILREIFSFFLDTSELNKHRFSPFQ